MKEQPFYAQIYLTALVWMLAFSPILLPTATLAQSSNANKSTSLSPAKGGEKASRTVQPTMSNSKPAAVRENAGAGGNKGVSGAAFNPPSIKSKPTPEEVKVAQKQEAIAKEKAAQKPVPALTTSNKSTQAGMASTNAKTHSSKPNLAGEWPRKRAVTKKHFLSQGMTEADAEKKLQELDKQYGPKTK